MKIAIVGASKLTENEERDAQQFCGSMMNQWMNEYLNDLLIISGGAKGVDSIAQQVAENLQLNVRIFKPETNNWEGYRTRNMKIAEECDILYCLPANFRDMECYHCVTNEHQKSGGCWTAKYAKRLGKKIKIIEPFTNYS